MLQSLSQIAHTHPTTLAADPENIDGWGEVWADRWQANFQRNSTISIVCCRQNINIHTHAWGD